MLSRESKCSWSSADSRCSNYIWVINNFIAFLGVAYIRGLAVIHIYGPNLIVTKPVPNDQGHGLGDQCSTHICRILICELKLQRNSVHDNALAAPGARSSATILLIMQDNHLNQEWFPLPAPSHCNEMIENANIILCFPQKIAWQKRIPEYLIIHNTVSSQPHISCSHRFTQS